MLATIVDTKALLQTVGVSLVAGLGVTVTFSMMVFGATRLADLRRHDRPVLAAAAGVLSAVALAITVGAIVLGIVVMAKK
jgi:predicted RecB family nuclease